jgi:hypothetical protein
MEDNGALSVFREIQCGHATALVWRIRLDCGSPFAARIIDIAQAHTTPTIRQPNGQPLCSTQVRRLHDSKQDVTKGCTLISLQIANWSVATLTQARDHPRKRWQRQ